MRLEFKPQAFDDLQYWVRHQPKLAKRLLRLIEETQRDPFGGIGKPEPLKTLKIPLRQIKVFRALVP